MKRRDFLTTGAVGADAAAVPVAARRAGALPVFRRQQLCRPRIGPLHEVWFDGAVEVGPGGMQQECDWARIRGREQGDVNQLCS